MKLTQNYLGVKLITEDTTKGGIVMPGNVDLPTKKGKVVLVGPTAGYFGKDNVESYVRFKNDMVVHFNKFSGEMKLEHDGQELLILRDTEIIAYE